MGTEASFTSDQASGIGGGLLMWRLTAPLTILMLAWTCNNSVLAAIDKEKWDKTTALKQLPFCAFILRTFLGQTDSSREIHILMEPDHVTEDNLGLLFRVVSERYPPSLSLRVWVYTDVEELASLATESGHTSYPDTEAKGKEEQQWAYYKRTEEVELFRYNPDYPKPGMKTVIFRGKE